MSHICLVTIVSAIILFAQITDIGAQDAEPQGKLLTPEEGCGILKTANTKIVGGTEAKPGALPWMALIGIRVLNRKDARFDCGGSLITSRHVLSAAHCYRVSERFDNYVYVVKLGAHDITKNDTGAERIIEVLRVEKHSDFTPVENGDGLNDIAIFTLLHHVEFNDHIRPICLPLTKDIQRNSFAGTNPFVAGWGHFTYEGKMSDVLMQAQIPVIDNGQCKLLYQIRYLFVMKQKFTDAVLCAGHLKGGQDACQGDSGGPLMLPIMEKNEFRMYQIGIVSWGAGCGTLFAPGVYTRVSHFIDWIQEKIHLN